MNLLNQIDSKKLDYLVDGGTFDKEVEEQARQIRNIISELKTHTSCDPDSWLIARWVEEKHAETIAILNL